MPKTARLPVAKNFTIEEKATEMSISEALLIARKASNLLPVEAIT
jgi:hypothetical protein